jgi:hypothetical protein
VEVAEPRSSARRLYFFLTLAKSVTSDACKVKTQGQEPRCSPAQAYSRVKSLNFSRLKSQDETKLSTCRENLTVFWNPHKRFLLISKKDDVFGTLGEFESRVRREPKPNQSA